MIDGVSSQPFSAVAMPPIEAPPVNHRDRATAFSRAQYSRPRAEVEQDISDWVGKKYEDPDGPEKERIRTARRIERATGVIQNNTSRPPHDAPRTTSAPHDRSAPPRPAQLPRSAPHRPPERKPIERNTDELRSMLAHIVPQTTQPPTVKSDTATRARPAPPRPLAPARNDGKSVTDEGKAELRTLLSSLTNGTVPGTPPSNTPSRPQTPPAIAPTGPRVSTGITPPPALDDANTRQSTQKTTQGRTAPAELSDGELRDMLRVDKPNLE